MSDDKTVETAESADAATGGQNPNPDTAKAQNPNPDANDNQEGQPAKTFTQDEVTRLIARETDKAKKAVLKELQDKQAEADMSELDKLKKRLAEVEAEKARIERERVLDRIAAKHKLPGELRDRLKGDSEDELEEDAASLAKLIVTAAPSLPNIGAQNGGVAKPGAISDEELESVAQMMGLPVPKK